mmetsp:Transcript_2370/g.3693  ORF Transcript_2370/g.3693 Transcript_2370/m.3693 type:complete len:87 (-) Transcript_2370:19-279(-)
MECLLIISITGPISLERFPPNLSILRAENNRIRKHTVVYDTIPKSVWVIGLRVLKGNQIHNVRAIDPCNAVSKKSIFSDFQRKDVE